MLEADNAMSQERQKAGEMAQWLRALAALREDLGSIPSTHKAAHSCPRRLATFFWPPWALHACVYGHVCQQNICTHKIIIKNENKRKTIRNFQKGQGCGSHP